MAGLLALLALAADPMPATRITFPTDAKTVAAAVSQIERQAGPSVRLDGLDPAARFDPPAGPIALWDAVGRTGGRLVLGRQGRSLSLAAGPSPPAAADGAFRLAVRGVTCRHEYAAGPPSCEVALDLHWEPRLAVVRVDAQPAVNAVADDRGSTLSAPADRAKSAAAGSLHPTSVRVTGVPRAAAKLATLDVSFTVAAAEKRLVFTVPDLTAPKPQARDGVTLTPSPARDLGDVTEFRLELTYPEGHPEFESFESWTAGNRCRLVHRDGRTLTTDDFEVSEGGRKAVAAYRFRTAAVGDLAGWSLVLDTPGPLREFPVRFALKDIPLP